MNKVIDGALGSIVGDAMGVPIELVSRDICLHNPITKMEGYGVHNVCAGSWSDDTSMSLATMDSYISLGKIDYDDIMDKWYEWINDNKYTPSNHCFGVGHTCLEAIYNHSRKHIEPLKCGLNNIRNNGNGSLMRMFPVVYYAYYKNLEGIDLYNYVKNMSSLTHAHEISVLGCYIYVLYALKLLNGYDKVKAYKTIQNEDYSYFSNESIDAYKRILKSDIRLLKMYDIKSSAYIVDTLEASIWVLLKSKDYKEAIIGAINLGGDADTTGAVCGMLAGIIYKYESIPKEWLDKLIKKDYLIELSNKYEKELQK